MTADSTNQAILRMHRVAMFALVLTLAGFWIYVHWIEPRPFYDKANYDYEIPYVLDSLSVFKGHPYVFYGHPGTPLEVIGTAVLALTYPLTGGTLESFIMYHIRNPELFLTIVRGLLTLASMGCVILLARYALPLEDKTDVLFSIAVAACFYAFHPLAFPSLVLWSHDSFNLPAGSLLLLILLITLRSGRQLRWWQVSALGFGAGVLTSVQLYHATWVIGIIVAVATLYLLQKRGWLQAILVSINAGLASLLGFVVATLPIYEMYPFLFQWVKSLIFYQGMYGTGAPGITSPEQFSMNFMRLWNQLHVLFIAACLVMAMLGIAMFLQRRELKRNLGLWAVACGLSVQLIVTTLIIIKHPYWAYMLAVAAILPLLLAVAFALLRSSGPHIRLLCVGISIVVLIGFLYNLTMSVSNHHTAVSHLRSEEEEIERFFADYATATGQDRDSLVTLWTYGTCSPCYALWFGNQFAANVFSGEISQVCPYQGNLSVLGGEQLPVDWDIVVVKQSYLRDLLTRNPCLANTGEVVTSQAETCFSYLAFIFPSFEGSQEVPADYPIITTDSSLAGAVSIGSQLQTPWPIEVHNGDSFLWLGHGEEQGLKGSIWSEETRKVQVILDVAPGPGREDSLRTVEVTLENRTGKQTAQRQFDRAATLTFVAELQPGDNDFSIKVLEEATILTQPNGDTRPLLVLLHNVVVRPF
jgi:hypothetical protein